MNKPKLQPVRGTKDLYFEDAMRHEYIIAKAWKIAERYGFAPFSTPIFEFTEVFKRTLGDTSDVVNKEMYSFEDRGGEGITLRPEFTAGIARAYISNGLQQHLPIKAFSYGPLFRYERPQKGRQRQFHQVNAEWLGEASPLADVEIIALANDLLRELGITEGVTLALNSLGDNQSRQDYREALVSYLKGFEARLSEDSKVRLEKNPLRILDSKDAGDRDILKEAPSIAEYYTPAAQDFLQQVTEGLSALGIAYQLNPAIVRGLDYYSHTVFEFVVESEEMGSQNTVLAGGRYDGLMAQLGGPDTPAIGFAAGVERLALLASCPEDTRSKLAILPMQPEMVHDALKLAHRLRGEGVRTEVIAGNNLGKQLKKADKVQATHAAILGSDELARGVVQLKNLKSGEQNEIAIEKVQNEL
ncbi:MAG: histidine--tRNA ligase [Hyphomicrobiales bacterium]|nr:histidine--tRNA ligase [Hyphomicrobiales bacterium]